MTWVYSLGAKILEFCHLPSKQHISSLKRSSGIAHPGLTCLESGHQIYGHAYSTEQKHTKTRVYEVLLEF